MRLILQNARLVLLLVLLAVIFSAYQSASLRFDYDFESFFPDNDPALPFFKNYRKVFGHDNEFVLLSPESKKGIFNERFLQKIHALTGQLKELPFIEEVASPTMLKKVSLQGFATVQTPLLHYDRPDLYTDDSAYIYSSAQYKNNFFASDGGSVCLYIKTADGLSKQKSDTLAAQIKRLAENLGFDAVHYGGRIFAQSVFLQKLKDQFSLFILISFLFVTLLLWLTFRKIKAVALPVLLISISILITFGIMGMMQKPIDIMAIMIPTMIFVAGMSDVVHFYTKYSEEVNQGKDKEEIFKLISKEVAGPTFITLLSTVVGFLSLCYSGIKPIREFGIYTSIGIIVAFILTYTFLPAMLTLWPQKKAGRVISHHSSVSQKLFFNIMRSGRLISFVTVCVLFFSGWGLSELTINQKLLADLSDKEMVKQDLLFFENNYGGIRPLEIAVQIKQKDKTIWDAGVMRQINSVDSFVQTTYKPGFMVSAVSLLKGINEAYDDVYLIPTDTSEVRRDISFLKKNRNEKHVKKVVTPDGKFTRISAKIKDLGSLPISAYNNSLRQFIRDNTDTTALAFTITGTANLLDLNSDSLVENTLQGLLTGILALALLTFILHRSFKMVLVFLIPNVVPLLIMAGIMGFLGIPLKASTAIFFSIAFGIATDDTIHFISRFKLELNKKISPLRAFKNTYFETGKPVLLTTFILIGGFISLVLSDFESIRLFGVLTCLTLVVALVCELFLLPVLLIFLFKAPSSMRN